MGGAIAALSTFQERQQAVVAAKAVQQLMWSAQTKARVRETPTTGCTTLDGYRVQVTATNAQLHPVCDAALGTVMQTYNYPSGVRAAGATGSYVFYTLERGVSNVITGPPNPASPLADRTIEFCTTATNCASVTPTFSFVVSGIGAISNVQSSEGATDL